MKCENCGFENNEKALESSILLEKQSANNGSIIFNFAKKTERFRNYKISSEA